jgi:mono/diheme cytochrome c family protein
MTPATHWKPAGLLAAATIIFAAISTPTCAADASDIADGQQLFLQKGGCQGCHGWAGDGRKTDNQQPDGANLRETLLDRDIIILTIKCGRPGRT